MKFLTKMLTENFFLVDEFINIFINFWVNCYIFQAYNFQINIQQQQHLINHNKNIYIHNKIYLFKANITLNFLIISCKNRHHILLTKSFLTKQIHTPSKNWTLKPPITHSITVIFASTKTQISSLTYQVWPYQTWKRPNWDFQKPSTRCYNRCLTAQVKREFDPFEWLPLLFCFEGFFFIYFLVAIVEF